MYKRLAAGICLATAVWAHSELEEKTEKASEHYLFKMPKIEETVRLPTLDRVEGSDVNYGILGYKRFELYKKK